VGAALDRGERLGDPAAGAGLGGREHDPALRERMTHLARQGFKFHIGGHSRLFSMKDTVTAPGTTSSAGKAWAAGSHRGYAELIFLK
jgi:hypothetical protein